jgi:hypothetical protein
MCIDRLCVEADFRGSGDVHVRVTCREQMT